MLIIEYLPAFFLFSKLNLIYKNYLYTFNNYKTFLLFM